MRPGDPDPVTLFRFFQEGMQREGALMLSRLTALLSSQSFLLIAYASSMASANGRWHQPFTLLLPPCFALLGLVLAVEGRLGIQAARQAAHRWAARADAMLASDPSLAAWTDGSDARGTSTIRRAGELFASRSPTIFAVAWLWFLALPFAMRALA